MLDLARRKLALPTGWQVPAWSQERTDEFLFAAIRGLPVGAFTLYAGRDIVDGAARLVALATAGLPASERTTLPAWPGLERIAIRGLPDAPTLYRPENDVPIGLQDFPLRLSASSMLFMRWHRKLPHGSDAVSDAAERLCMWRYMEVPVIEAGSTENPESLRIRLNRR